MSSNEALAVLEEAGASLEGGRIHLPNRMYPKRVWDAFDYLVFECNYGFTLKDAEPMVG